MKRTNNSNRGVTLVEIAIVLVIIGLLLGGILKGQELINNAKVRAIADRQNSLKVSWFAFVDRYQALPADYVRARQNVPGAGDNIALGAKGVGAGDGLILEGESPIALQNMTGAGYLRCPQCTENTGKLVAPTATNSLQNQYGGVMAIFVDGGGLAKANTGGSDTDTYAFDVGTSAVRTPRLMVHTGPNIPSNIIAEVDRKLDDGQPQNGDFRASDYTPVGLSPVVGCLDLTADNGTQDATDYDSLTAVSTWRDANAPPEANCGGAVII
ncbi:MAG: prepilin-type N-terminal cleavage/methylation domain-containing protein [Gammaproteobacteria bacterium]